MDIPEEIKNLIIIKLPNRKLISLNKYYNNYKYFIAHSKDFIRDYIKTDTKLGIFFTGHSHEIIDKEKIPIEIYNRMSGFLLSGSHGYLSIWGSNMGCSMEKNILNYISY